MRKTLLTTAVLLLAACASSPSPVYYTLPNSSFIMPEQTRGKTETAVRVILAEPLNRGGLGYRPADGQLNLAHGHLWAQPLEQALASRLSNELNRAGNPIRYYVPAHQSSSSHVVTIYIEDFSGSWQGETLVAGYLRNGNGSRRFVANTPQIGDGYPAMVQSLSQGINAAVRQINRGE